MQAAVPWCLCFSSMLLWGAYPLCRRLSAKADTGRFVLFHFVAEIALAAALCASLDKEFFGVKLVRAFEHEPRGTGLLLVAGAITAGADVVFITALKSLPSSVYPMMVGTTMTSSITVSYLLDGSPSPTLLFTGLGFCVISVFGQALAAAAAETSGPKGAYGAESTTAVLAKQVRLPAITITVGQDVEVGAKVDDSDLDTTAVLVADVARDASGSAWVIVLIATALLKSGWVPLTLIGRTSVDANESYFLYICGRVLVQPLVACLKCLCQSCSESARVSEIGSLSFAHVLCGLLSGVALSGGYYTFWIGSEYLPKSAALAIGYSCPLVTLILGFFLGDYKHRPKRARRFMAVSGVIFALGLATCALSGAVTTAAR